MPETPRRPDEPAVDPHDGRAVDSDGRTPGMPPRETEVLVEEPPVPAAGPAPASAVVVAPWRLGWRRYRKHRTGLFGLAVVLGLLVVALFAPVLANDDPIAVGFEGGIYFPAVSELFGMEKGGPFSQVTFDLEREFDVERDWAVWPPIPWGPTQTTREILQDPSAAHWLGTDVVGRDVMARMIYGARISMMVGFVSMGIASLLGILIGAVAGFFGGIIDIVISRVIEVVMCFPTFFLILSIMAWLPPSIWNVMIVIGITRWTGLARYVRGEFIRLRSVDFSVAAIALGAGSPRIIFRHILPNSLAPVFVPITFGVAIAIFTEAALSWLGFGVQPPDPSWGNILRMAFDNIFTAPYMIYPPCVAIFIAVLGYNLVGDTLRDVIDPRLSGSR